MFIPKEELKEAKPEKVGKPTVEDLAAHDFMGLLPEFRKKIEELTNRQLKRVVTALMEHPFEGGFPKFSYPQEVELFQLGCKIQDCRFVLMKAVLSMKQDEIQALMDETKGEKEANVGKKNEVAEARNDQESGQRQELSGSGEPQGEVPAAERGDSGDGHHGQGDLSGLEHQPGGAGPA